MIIDKELTKNSAKKWGLSISDSGQVWNTKTNSLPSKLKNGDKIMSIDNTLVNNKQDILNILENKEYQERDAIQLKLFREEEEEGEIDAGLPPPLPPLSPPPAGHNAAAARIAAAARARQDNGWWQRAFGNHYRNSEVNRRRANIYGPIERGERVGGGKNGAKKRSKKRPNKRSKKNLKNRSKKAHTKHHKKKKYQRKKTIKRR